MRRGDDRKYVWGDALITTANRSAAKRGGGKELAKKSELKISLDYPQEGERITGSHYSFRIKGIRDVGRIEVSIDSGPWEPCRHASGYWWFDWEGFPEGCHQAVVRGRTKDGRALNSRPRRFAVIREASEESAAPANGSIQ